MVGFLGTDVVYARAFTYGVFRTDLEGEPRRITGVTHVTDIDHERGLVAGSLALDGERGTVIDPVGGERLWQARRYLEPFTPDGSLIVGQAQRTWSVLDATTGRERYDLDVPDRASLYDLAWEDDRHLLAVAFTRRETAIVRFDQRGRAELAAPVIPHGPRDPAYLLESRP